MKERTEAQKKATIRNHGIRSLRAFRALAHQLAPHRRDLVQALVDDELRYRGAMTYSEQIDALDKEHRKRQQKRIARTQAGNCFECGKPHIHCACPPF